MSESQQPPKVYILSGSGFIGNRLVELLGQKGFIVQGFSSKECDLLSLTSVESALVSATRNDAIVFAAAITRLRDNSFAAFLKNIQMAEHVGAIATKQGVQALIFLSAVDVYGLLGEGITITEKLPIKPQDYYSLSKYASEIILQLYCSAKDIPLTVLRLSGIYGPGDEGKSTVNAMVASALKTGRIFLYGDGLDKRDFVYVDDVAELISHALLQRTTITVNVATGKSATMAEIGKIISNHVRGASIEFKEKKPDGPKRIRSMIYDTSLLRQSFPGVTFQNLSEGVVAYLQEIWRKNG